MWYVYVSTRSFNWFNICFIPLGMCFWRQCWSGFEIPWQTDYLLGPTTQQPQVCCDQLLWVLKNWIAFYKAIVCLRSIFGKDVHWAEKSHWFQRGEQSHQKVDVFPQSFSFHFPDYEIKNHNVHVIYNGISLVCVCTQIFLHLDLSFQFQTSIVL